MHAARGEAAATAASTTMPTAASTAMPNAVRARWNKLKQASRTTRTFRNGGKQRVKRLSKVMKARRNESGGGGGGGGGEELKTVLSVHVDEKSGRRYSCNEATGHAQWLSGDDGGDEATIEEKGESTNTIRIAAFDYVAAESGELSMKVGDEIEILEILGASDWYKGKNLRTGDVGDCPVSYLEINIDKKL